MRPHLPRQAHLARIASNRRSYRVLRRLMAHGPSAQPGPQESVDLRPLGGRPVWIRPGTSDAQVVWETFVGRYHLPPTTVPPSQIHVVWDLGANIGLTMAHIAALYARARIVGVELDPGNADLARANVAAWGDRCEVLQAAVWPEDGEVRYAAPAGQEYGFRVDPGTGDRLARALSLATLLGRQAEPPCVDYVKMDIEGAERDVLKSNTGWARHVRSIKVEVHPPYTVGECVEDLGALGFRSAPDRRHWACAVGTRFYPSP